MSDRITSRTTLSELQARVRQDSVDRSSQLLRSIQGSLRVEGYVVSEAVLRAELEKLNGERIEIPAGSTAVEASAT